jgi:hypothetical protein
MKLLNKPDALHYVEQHAAVADSPRNAPNPYGTSTWLRHFIDEVMQPDDHVLVAESLPVSGAGPDGFMLLLVDQKRREAQALSNFYTSLCAPICSEASDRRAVMQRLVDDLASHRPGLHSIKWSPLDADAEDVNHLQACLRASGWHVRRFFCFGNRFEATGGKSFAEYMAGRDSKLRNTFERKSKKLQAIGRIEIISSPDQVDAAMDAYERIYAKSWKNPEPYPNFSRGWARRCAEQGWLRLGVAWLGEEPIAAQIWYVFQGRGYIYKLAYDEAHAKLSAGTVLTGLLMRHVLEIDRVQEVDFLSGDDAYKRAWMADRRDRIGLLASNLRTPRGLLLAGTQWLAERTATWRKPREGAWGRHDDGATPQEGAAPAKA